jgi:hypothetical protein
MSWDVRPLDEQFEVIDKVHGSFESYKQNYFVKLSPLQRVGELDTLSRAWENEPPRPTKEYASHMQRRRELISLDQLLLSCGR